MPDAARCLAVPGHRHDCLRRPAMQRPSGLWFAHCPPPDRRAGKRFASRGFTSFQRRTARIGPLSGGTALLQARSTRSGVSLMEVLISIFVLSIGLLSLAALIPVGGMALRETAKSDRAGACGRAALREARIRRLVDPQYWSNPQATLNGSAVALDPVGVNAGMGNALGLLPRLTFKGITPQQIEQIFYGKDDLHVHILEDPTLRPHIAYYQPNGKIGPTPTSSPVTDGHYSWLMTVTPVASEIPLPLAQRTHYHVSVAVCYRRDLSPQGEQAVQVAQFLSQGLGGGSVRLADPVMVKENEWIMLCGQRPSPVGGSRTICQWYRVMMVSEPPITLITLAGPDWDPQYPATAVIIKSVVGVYSTVVELDQNPRWRRAW